MRRDCLVLLSCLKCVGASADRAAQALTCTQRHTYMQTGFHVYNSAEGFQFDLCRYAKAKSHCMLTFDGWDACANRTPVLRRWPVSHLLLLCSFVSTYSAKADACVISVTLMHLWLEWLRRAYGCLIFLTVILIRLHTLCKEGWEEGRNNDIRYQL